MIDKIVVLSSKKSQLSRVIQLFLLHGDFQRKHFPSRGETFLIDMPLFCATTSRIGQKARLFKSTLTRLRHARILFSWSRLLRGGKTVFKSSKRPSCILNTLWNIIHSLSAKRWTNWSKVGIHTRVNDACFFEPDAKVCIVHYASSTRNIQGWN